MSQTLNLLSGVRFPEGPPLLEISSVVERQNHILLVASSILASPSILRRFVYTQVTPATGSTFGRVAQLDRRVALRKRIL